MPPLCDSCGDHVDKLNQQVSTMRKEINNLRRTLDNAVRSHRKHMTSLSSAVTDVAACQQQRSSSSSPPPPSSPEKTEVSPRVSLERGNIQTVPIGYISSCFLAKNGTPRQPTVCGPSRATLSIEPSVFNNPDHALVGLQHFSHVWVIFLFHKNGHLSYKAKVKPPRLNGQRVGVYSTRTPHRPNALGLTLAKVDRIVGKCPTIHLSGIDMIDGTPVLDIKPYISDYDSPLSRPVADAEPYEAGEGRAEAAASSVPPDEETGRMNSGSPSPGGDVGSLARAEVTKVTGVDSTAGGAREVGAVTTGDMNRSDAPSLAVADAHARSAAPLSKALSNALAEVEAYVNETHLNIEQEVSKSKPPDATPCSPGPCYGEEAYSTIAAWIRAPPIGDLEVRFTPYAQRELAEFLPPQISDPPGNNIRPHFKFLRGPEEAAAAIRGVLSADPRSVYRRTRCGDRLFYFTLDTADITCWFGPGFAEVLRVQPRDDPNRPCKGNGNGSFNLVDKVSVLDGDLTFKSFACSGGEVEILDHSDVAEDGVQPMYRPSNAWLQGDETVSDSLMIHDSGNDHMDHPYCYPEDGDDVAMNHTVPPTEHSNSVSSLASADMDALQEPTLVNGGAEGDVTYKSFACDGGEVEVLDATVCLLSETVPLPEEELVDQRPDDSDSMSIVVDDCGGQDHTDHPYSSKECGFAQNPEPTDGPTDITLRSFVCTGGEVEVSDDTTVAGETIPLPSVQLGVSSYLANDESVINQSELAGNWIIEPHNGHVEHCYFNTERLISPSPSGDRKAPQDPLPSSTGAPQLEELDPLATDGGKTHGAFDSLSETAGDVNPTGAIIPLEKPVSLLEGPAEVSPPSHNSSSHDQELPHQQPCAPKGDESVEPAAVGDSVITDASTPAGTNVEESQDAAQTDSSPAEASAVYCAVQPVDATECRACEAPAPAPPQSSITLQVEGQVIGNAEVHLRSDTLGCSGVQKDSALGMSSDAPCPAGSVEKAPAESPSDILAELREFPAVRNTQQFELFSPVAMGTPLARIRTYKDSPLAKCLAEDSLLDWEKSLSPVKKGPLKGPFMGPMESPMPRPLFNSTSLGTRYSGEPPAIVVREVPELKRSFEQTRRSVVAAAVAAPVSQEQKGLLDLPTILNGPLEQQLRQMAELILASVKVSTLAAPFPATAGAVGPAPTAAAATIPPETHSVCVGNSPMKLVDRCFNTSGEFERKREFSVADGCTATDPLLWNVPAGSLEAVSKRELEQRLRSSMIMVEALVQQLDMARAQQSRPAGPPPSQLRDTLVQTDHTELTQTSTYRDLYMTALGRIQELEMDQSSVQSLIQAMQGTKITVGMLSAETAAAISTMKQREQAVREDRCSLLAQYGEMKVMCGRFKESHARMMQKVRDALREREDMRRRMDEAFSAKEAAFSVTEQLRVHCAQQISEMEQSVGCHQELKAALNKAYPKQVALNQAYVETLGSASDLLSRTLQDQASLAEELARVRALLKKTVPTLLKLNEKAADALSERDQHLLDRDQAVEERQQIQDALQQAHLDLQDAGQQIGDLNIQATIMKTELGVLREKLSEGEFERAQLERKVTELSATISSTLASYTFLEQALASESTMLQQSRRDLEQATDKAAQLEALLGPSEQRVCELSKALDHSEQQLEQLQDHAHAQTQQLLQLRDTCTQLSTAREMNEFLQMENELVREQIAENEGMFQANLQSLRERNIQCEDLKGALGRLKLEKASAEAELEATRSRASDTQQSLGEQLSHGVTAVAVELHKLRGLTCRLHTALGDDQKPESSKDGVSQAMTPGPDRRHNNRSFVDSVMVALSTEEDEEQGLLPPPFEGLLSETSAFSRITPAVTPKKVQRPGGAEELGAELGEEAELGSSDLPELLPELSSTVSELLSTLDTLLRRKDAQLEEMHHTICDLQREQQAAASRQRDELAQLTNQLSRLSGQVEKGSLALQQKTQDEKALMNLFDEVNEARETLNKHKTENLELRRMLQQSQVEARALRDELREAGSASASTAHLMDQKIELLQEVERLKEGLEKAEQTRTKLLDRAKRHQMVYQTNEQRMENELRMVDHMVERARKTLMSIPDVVQGCEELRKLVDYIS
ncbi:unnamed protein product [Merluccius merluccius]